MAKDSNGVDGHVPGSGPSTCLGLRVLLEPAARELTEALARLLVRHQRGVVGDVAGDLFGYSPNLRDNPCLVFGIAEQLLDPSLRAVVGLDVVFDQQLAENEPDAD